MKATGIVRRIDDLGRVVIPKEIRRNFRMKEGDPLEIYTNSGGEIMLKTKKSPKGEPMTTISVVIIAILGIVVIVTRYCDLQPAAVTEVVACGAADGGINARPRYIR